MSDLELRLVVVGGVVVGALVWIWATRRRAERRGDPVDVSGLVDGPAAVVFTKDDCQTCVQTLDRLRALDLPIRQVRAEEHPEALATRDITGVPVTVIVDAVGTECGRFRGLPGRAALRRAVRRAR